MSTQRLKLATSNLVHSLSLPRPIIKSHSGEKVGWPWLPKRLWFPCNISAMAGVSDFKFGTQLVFAKAHHKIMRRRKGGHGPGLGEFSKIWGFSFNIYTMAEASDFKFGTQIGFAKAHHKIIPERKNGVALG